MKLIIAGGRNYTDYVTLKAKLLWFLKETDLSSVEVVCGLASGVDTLGERFAKEFCSPTIHYFPADWDKLGKSAGFKRNKQMAEAATHCIAFWDGQSPGTKSMIDLAKQYNLNLRVIRI